MLSFLKELFGKVEDIKVPNTSIAVSNEFTGEKKDNKPKNDKGIMTELSLHSTWEENLDQEQKYVLSFIHDKLPNIHKAIFFHPIHVETTAKGYRITLFIRNGLNKNIRLSEAPLSLINNEKVIASSKFKFIDAGEIPPESSRPWTIEFTDEMVFQMGVKTFKAWGLKVALLKPVKVNPNLLQLTPEWDKKITVNQKKGLLELMNQMPPVPLNRVEFVPVEVDLINDQGIVATLLIRNGYSAEVQLKNTPLLLMDKEKGHVAAGIFDMAGLSIKPGASMPWNFFFKKEDIIIEDFDPHRLEVVHGAKQINV